MRLRSSGRLLVPLFLFSLLCLGISGCAMRTVAEHATVREGMDTATRTIRSEHKQWSQMAHDGTPLPKLSDFDLKSRLAAHKAYEDLVNADRANDKK